jgi:3-oxoacyl-[acyl-carrier protein] reductase
MSRRFEGIEDRVALVTGGARGIGACIAQTLAAHGARVAAADLVPPQEENVLGLVMDVADERSVDEGFSRVERELG